MTHTTESIIEALRAGAWAAEIKLMDIAADRLEELQRDVVRLRRITTRPEPSRLVIASILLAAQVGRESGTWESQEAAIWAIAQADIIIAAAKEAE